MIPANTVIMCLPEHTLGSDNVHLDKNIRAWEMSYRGVSATALFPNL